MSDQAHFLSVGQKALDEDVSGMLGVIPTLPFERAFAQHSRSTIEGRQIRLKSRTVDTKRRNPDKRQN